ncbi:SpoVG family protein, partial [candidate division FCPU426 bacterium]|nr:SpoVG family protein [candidate division FCPU426 bacterium]
HQMEKKLIKVERLYLNPNEGAVKAFVVLKVADAFIIRKVKVMKGKNGLFVALPTEKYTDKTSREDKYAKVVFPANKETQAEIQSVVLAAYQAEKQSGRTVSG